MNGDRAELESILDQELALHRELLAIARLRHIMLRQGRVGALYALRTAEASRVSTLRRLGAARAHLAGRSDAGERREVTPRIAATIRRIGAVERANRALLVRHVVRTRRTGDGVAVWAAS